MTAERTYRGVSADDRRALRRERLVEAALDIVGEEGVAAVNMKSVRQRAELSERYFYESFRDRTELLIALLDDLSQTMQHTFAESLSADVPDLLSRSRAGALAVIDVMQSDARRARLFVEAARGGAITAHRTPYYEAHAAIVAAQFREHLGSAASDDDPHLRATSLLLVSGLAQTLGVWLDGNLDLTREELADHFARLCVAAATTLADA